MKVHELIETLRQFDPDAPVRVGVSWPDRVTEIHERIWVGDYGGAPQINAAMDLRGISVYVGCSLQRSVENKTTRTIRLGHYTTAEEAAKVRDFYVYHQKIDEPLNYPDFDYENWIPPRMTSGEYNEHIAMILREKLLKD